MAELKLKIRNVLFRLLNSIENNGVADIHKNGEYRLLKQLISQFSGSHFSLLDVGANEGHFTLAALDTFNKVKQGTAKDIRVFAFEPLPATFKKLQANLSSYSNCTPVNLGISETKEEREIYFNADHHTCASLYDRPVVQNAVPVRIALERLDTFIRNNNIQHIDFLKVDTEGHELSVLKSAGEYLSPRYIEAIQFEYGGTYLDSRIYLRDIYHLLTPKGYGIYKIFKNHIAQRSYHPAMENFQYANYIALPGSV